MKRVAAIAVSFGIAIAMLFGIAISAAAGAPAARFAPGHVLLRGLDAYAIADAVGGTLWVVSQSTSGESVVHELDAVTGAAGPQLALGRVDVGNVLYAEGWLWIGTAPFNGHGADLLWRLEPDTLAVMSQTPLGAGPGVPSVASAGASIWAGTGNELYRTAAIGGAVIGRVPVRGARQIELATGAGGRSLLVSEGNGSGIAYVQRRDAVTGRLVASSARFLGVTEPALGGTYGGRLWLSEATGMAGYVASLNAASLRPVRASGPGAGVGPPSNGIRARVIDGVLWVSDPGDRGPFNYCGNPLSGRPRLALPAALRRGVLVTGDASRVYYLKAPYDNVLMSATIPAGCR